MINAIANANAYVEGESNPNIHKVQLKPISTTTTKLWLILKTFKLIFISSFAS